MIPGPRGPAGTAGTNGTNGSNSFTTVVSSSGNLPAISANVTLQVINSSWMAIGEPVFVQFWGSGFVVVSVPDSTHVTIQNTGNTDNQAPGTPVVVGARVMPTGFQGPTGALSGAVGGVLTGSLPNPGLAAGVVTDSNVAAGNKDGAAGTASMRTLGTGATQAAAGSDTRFTNARAPTGVAGGSLAGSYPNPTLSLTGPSAGTSGSEALIPAITVNTEGRITAISTKQPRYGLLGKITAVDLNVAGDNNILISVLTAKYIVSKVLIESASANLTNARAGLFGVGGGGAPQICADQALAAITGTGKWMVMTISGAGLTDILTAATLFFRVGTPQGGIAIANVWIFGENIA